MGAAYVARLRERGVAEPMELATLLQRVNSQRVATVQAFEAHLDMIVACAEAFYGGDGGGVGQEEALRQRGRAHMLRDEGLDLLAEIDAGLIERLAALAALSARREAQSESQSETVTEP